MTDLFTTPAEPPTPPASPEPPSPPGPRRDFSAFAWVAIVIITAFIAVMQYQAQKESEAQPVSDVERVNLQLRLMGRYVVGVKQIFEKLPGMPVDQLADQVAGEVDGNGSRVVDQLRVIPVLAELEGADAALIRLAELQSIETLNEDIYQDVDDLKRIYREGGDALSDEASTRLRRRHRWFGRLALAWGLADSDPRRQVVLTAAMRTALTVLAAFMLIGLFGLAGLVLLVVGIVMLATGRIRPAFAAVPECGSAWIETVMIFLLVFVVMSFIGGLVEKRTGADLADVMIWLLPVTLLWPKLRGLSWLQWREGLGLHRGRGVLAEMLFGLLGQLAGLPLLFFSILIVFFLSWLITDPAPHPISEEVLGGEGVWSAVKIYVLACVWAPLFEEMVFRGAFYHHLRGQWPAVIAALASGFIFAAIHPQGMIAVPALMSLAFVFAMLREWRGSLIAPMTAHALNNGFVVTLALLLLR